MIESIGHGWPEALEDRMRDGDRAGLEDFLAGAWTSGGPAVYPRADQVFAAFRMAPEAVRAVILGQDPYANPGQACGLAFSVQRMLPEGVRRPPSLGRILSELRREGFGAPVDATLDSWTEKGVLLLNTALTVLARDPGSHAAIWQPFTTAVIGSLVEQTEPIAFLMWGKAAHRWSDLIRPPHKAICSPHPLARGRANRFAGSDPFVRANAFLGPEREIAWAIAEARAGAK